MLFTTQVYYIIKGILFLHKLQEVSRKIKLIITQHVETFSVWCQLPGRRIRYTRPNYAKEHCIGDQTLFMFMTDVCFIVYRLNSFFNQKFIHGNGSVNRTMGRQVMNAYHPELPREVRKAGNITFSDITHWIQDGHIDSHFDGPYLKKCDPCFVNYDYVVKLESQPEDSAYIIKNKLQGRGVGTALNVQRDTSSNNPLLSSSGKKLNIFKNLTVEQMQFMHDRLQPDLDMFGYTFDETNLLAKCGYENKDCCWYW